MTFCARPHPRSGSLFPGKRSFVQKNRVFAVYLYRSGIVAHAESKNPRPSWIPINPRVLEPLRFETLGASLCIGRCFDPRGLAAGRDRRTSRIHKIDEATTLGVSVAERVIATVRGPPRPNSKDSIVNSQRSTRTSPVELWLSIAVLATAISGCTASVEPVDDSSSAVQEARRKKDAGSDSGGHGGGPDGGVHHIDLSGWELQLPTGPTGHPDTVTNLSGYSSIYFHVDGSGVVNFMDPTTGTTTSGSLHPRSELREVTSGWSATRTNRLSVTAQVTQVVSKVTIGQIFQAPSAPSKPLLELEYNKGGQLRLLLEKTNQGGSANFYDVGAVVDGSEFTYELSLSGGAIEITVDGKVSTFALPPTFKGESFYFKCGDYDQTATKGSPGTTPGTVVKFYDVTVVHQ